MNENVIEFFRNAPIATVTFSQGRYVHKIKEYAKVHPDECQITAQNDDGSIVAHIPTSWIKIRPPRVMELTEEEKEIRRERFVKNIKGGISK